MGEPQLQARVQRHTVEQRIEHTPYVQILDAPVPQVADFVMDVFRALDSSIAEQVIEVPKLSCSSCPSRSPCLEPQMAEQLVDVPTVLSYALLQQRNVEQIVDIPVPLGRGRRLQDSLPRQGSTASGAEQIADSPFGGGLHGFLPGLVPTASGVEQLVDISSGGLQGFSPGHESGQRSAEQNVDIPAPSFRSRGARRTAEQNVDIPVRRSRAHGGLQGFSPGQSSTQRTVTPNDDLPVPGPRPTKTGFAAHSGAPDSMKCVCAGACACSTVRACDFHQRLCQQQRLGVLGALSRTSTRV